jgi:hypothetical protein
MVLDLVLSKPYTVYIVYNDVEGTGEIRSFITVGRYFQTSF